MMHARKLPQLGVALIWVGVMGFQSRLALAEGAEDGERIRLQFGHRQPAPGWILVAKTNAYGADPGFNVIDATILVANAKFHLIVKDETRHPPKKHLRIASSADLAGPYENLSAPFTRDWVEGPTALKVGEDWLVYFDAYQDHRYEARRSRDLQHWEDVTARISLPRGTRHGTALAVPANVIQNLLAAKPGARAAN